MKSNQELQADVQDAVRWEPTLRSVQVTVSTDAGDVTLDGGTDSFALKSKVWDTVKKVAGVKSLIDHIKIHPGPGAVKSDADLTYEITQMLSSDGPAYKKVLFSVADGVITLRGELNWHYQKEVLFTALKALAGVMGISNNIIVSVSTHEKIEKRDIERALERNWAIDDMDIDVTVWGQRVTLNGTVNSWYQKDEAERIAWDAPGVCTVVNQLALDFDN
jgi:osmotically-inducible protein OsmY